MSNKANAGRGTETGTPETEKHALGRLQRRWKRRAGLQLVEQAKLIAGFRKMANDLQDPELIKMVERMDNLYCRMADNATVRLLINGIHENPETANAKK